MGPMAQNKPKHNGPMAQHLKTASRNPRSFNCCSLTRAVPALSTSPHERPLLYDGFTCNKHATRKASKGKTTKITEIKNVYNFFFCDFSYIKPIDSFVKGFTHSINKKERIQKQKSESFEKVVWVFFSFRLFSFPIVLILFFVCLFIEKREWKNEESYLRDGAAGSLFTLF